MTHPVRYHGVDGTVPREIPDRWAPLAGPRAHPEGEPLEGSIGRGLFFGVIGTAIVLLALVGLVQIVRAYPWGSLFGAGVIWFGILWRKVKQYDRRNGLG